jgi:hypothetical protein
MRREGTLMARELGFIPPASLLVGRYKGLIREPSVPAPVAPVTETRSSRF